MRKLLFLCLLLPVAMLSQDLKNESPQTLSSKVDDFVISFYASHIEVDKMIPAPQSVLIKNKFLVNAAQMSLTLRNFRICY